MPRPGLVERVLRRAWVILAALDVTHQTGRAKFGRRAARANAREHRASQPLRSDEISERGPETVPSCACALVCHNVKLASPRPLAQPQASTFDPPAAIAHDCRACHPGTQLGDATRRPRHRHAKPVSPAPAQAVERRSCEEEKGPQAVLALRAALLVVVRLVSVCLGWRGARTRAGGRGALLILERARKSRYTMTPSRSALSSRTRRLFRARVSLESASCVSSSRGEKRRSLKSGRSLSLLSLSV